METLRPIDICLRLGTIGSMIAGCSPALSPNVVQRGANWTESSAAVETSCTDMRGFAIPRPTPPMPEGVICINFFNLPKSTTRVVVVETTVLVNASQIGRDGTVVITASRKPADAIMGWRVNNTVELFDFTRNPPRQQTVWVNTSAVPVAQTQQKQEVRVESKKPVGKAERIAYANTIVPNHFPDSVKYWVPELHTWSQAHGLPASFTVLFAAIIWNESCGNPNAIGGNDYGLGQVNGIHWGGTPVADRLNPAINIPKAGQILLDAYLAAGGGHEVAAKIYTAGLGAVSRRQVSDAKRAYAVRVAQSTGPGSCTSAFAALADDG